MFADKKKKKDINIFVFSIFAIICFKSFSINAIKLPQDEVDALQQIATTLGSKYWKFDAESCTVEKVGLTETPPPLAEQVIECECSPTNETDCHVVKIALKDHSLPGTLPPQIVKLPKLREIDLAYNYLNGTIPLEWFTTNLTLISLLVNRLSGEIPKELGNLTSLTFLNLESNAFSGTIPQELGNLVNLGTLMLSSNNLTGNLPASLSKLQNMTDFRINDLQLNGTIPTYTQNWKELERLEIVASGLTGPIPSVISVLNNLKNLRISDIGGPVQPFPYLRNSTEISKLVLKNCNLAGQIPDYLSNFKNLETLDLSFNKLPGVIPSFAHAEKLRFLILTGNRLEGDVPPELLRDGITVDLSYNNLKWQSSESRSCRPNMNLNLNLFQSTSTKESSKVLPCIDDFKCPRYSSCLHVNCGGSDLTLKQNKTKILYQGDGEAEGGAAKYYLKHNSYWGFSSTGDYMDDNNFQNTRFTVFVPTSNLSDLYKSARIAPVSLTYFHACLENGKYTVNFDFAEMRFTNDETYNRLGRRVFDIYIQEKLVVKDFNIMEEAKGAQKPITKSFTVNVTNHFLAIRLSWAGKGTTRIPTRGVYGPLISAISIVSVKALGEIATTLGIKRLNLSDGDPCLLKTLKLDVVSSPNSDMENIILCDCSFNNNMTCHIIELTLKSISFSGKLPPELAKLKYLHKIAFCRNYLSGSIPMEWASLPNLTFISLCANRLSGPLPRGLQNFKSLTFLGVEANQFSGPIPDELGNLTNLTVLELASNQFTGSLPSSLARLVNLDKFRISDNNFTGIIPEYIGNWSRLTRLDIQASGLKGPFPDAVARLENLTNLFISDMTGINTFPNISSQAIKDLVLRNVSMSGKIPSYIWSKPNLRSLDLSFNKLTGEVLGINIIPKFTYLTGNMLSGEIKSGVYLNSRKNIDLSYNNFSWPSSCQERSNINTYRSSSLKNTLTGLLPCAGPMTCKHYKRSLHINCGGETVTVTNSTGKITYEADNSDQVKAATNQHFKNWGISNTGDFMDDNKDDDTYIVSTSLTLPGDSPDLYKTARRSALSLVYYAFCLENGEYNLKLHFMEIQFSDKELYSRLGRRIFDVYVQGKLFLRDFNIRQEANGTLKPVVKELKDVNVTDHKLEIWLYWAGKGTTLIPKRGNYGPLISAISLCHSLEQHCGVEKTKHHINYPLIFGVTGPLVAIIFLALGFYAHRKYRQDKKKRERDLRAQGLQTVCFTWRQLQAATNNFDEANKLGEGGFGSVFKGELSDGTIIAVKKLSSKSCQGNREFVNEIGMISGLNHPNLVKLYGCCVEKDQLLLVYEYMENNSLALALSGKSNSLKLDWAARKKICVGIARGLEFLHEGAAMRMIHRDIKTPNVLLDANLNAKISDFGLARLHEEEHTHISTKVAGTIGYMAPEYALMGHLTEKADVYSFGVVAMEIVSGKSNTTQKGSDDNAPLIKWAMTLQQKGDIMEIVDPKLEGEFNSLEAERMTRVALVCTNATPSLRPLMSEAVKMLEGEMEIPRIMSGPAVYGHDLNFSKLMEMQESTSMSGYVHALGEIATTLGIKRVNLSYKDPCVSQSLMIIKQVDWNPVLNNTIACDCSFNNNMTCHITELSLVNLTLVGKVPPELAKLRHLRSIDLSANYLTGTIPPEWVSMPYLTFIWLCGNRLSGNLPTWWQNFKNLKFLGIEGNQFSGTIPDELGNLTKLVKLDLASNQFTGSLPITLARLVNLEQLWISDNKFSGTIPAYIGKWSRLRKLFLHASGLKGPFPDAVACLENLIDLRISDTTGINSFPILSSKVIETLILRNVGLSGPIPSYIWNLPNLTRLDLSFNKLTGEIQDIQKAPKLKYTYLTGNMLSGNVESAFLINNKPNIDLSYNNFSWSSSCQEKSNINTYRSSILKNNLTGLLRAGPVNCKTYQRSVHINCGGEDLKITNSFGKITYQADNSKTNAATNHHQQNWGISNTGDFTDDAYVDDTFIISTSLRLSKDSPYLYKTARRSALSLVYYAFCLENGAYNVKLHFMEIQFSEKEVYSRIGRRIFDVYVQGKLFLRDFNIKEEANGTLKPVVKELKANVTDHLLEIRLYWAGKGTALIPNRGNYGPLISAISLCHSLEPQCGAEKIKHHISFPLILGATGVLVTITLLAVGIYARRRCLKDSNTIKRDLRAEGLQTVCFTWRQLQDATNNFDKANKLGEGGFGSVFKGELPDGTIIAVKQLSSKSCQGNREFVNEIGMISGLNHPNLVKLYGCCVEKNHLMLVYEYMENNSLALVLSGKSSMKLDWKTRQKICVGIARGLEFLHEGSMIRMVHRDIKTPNVLLDADLNAKISDFGLARLHEEEHTHISTKVAGTMGYMAPEYVLWGQLTEKADVYSFGVVAMEIVSGKSNTKHKGTADHLSLLDWALSLHQKGNILEVVDPVLEGHFNRKEAVRMINVALVCTNSSPALRPTMSEAMKMLEGVIELTQVSSDPGIYGDDWSLLKLRDIDDTHGSSSTSGVTDQTRTTTKSSVSGCDLYPLYPESMTLNSTVEYHSSSL
ncbi:unnamed protein product [Brassica rapa subsp. narinosa]